MLCDFSGLVLWKFGRDTATSLKIICVSDECAVHVGGVASRVLRKQCGVIFKCACIESDWAKYLTIRFIHLYLSSLLKADLKCPVCNTWLDVGLLYWYKLNILPINTLVKVYNRSIIKVL